MMNVSEGSTQMPIVAEESTLTIAHRSTCEELHNIFRVKNEAYGNSFSRTLYKHGPLAALIQMEHKFSRFETLVQHKATSMSMRDSLVDLANYAIITIAEIDNGNI